MPLSKFPLDAGFSILDVTSRAGIEQQAPSAPAPDSTTNICGSAVRRPALKANQGNQAELRLLIINPIGGAYSVSLMERVYLFGVKTHVFSYEAEASGAKKLAGMVLGEPVGTDKLSSLLADSLLDLKR